MNQSGRVLPKKTQKKTRKTTKINPDDIRTARDLVKKTNPDQYNLINQFDENKIDKLIEEIDEIMKSKDTYQVTKYQHLLDLIFTRFPNKNVFTQEPILQKHDKTPLTLKPSILDPKFQEKINRKKEFMMYKNKAPLDSVMNNDEYKDKKLDFILNSEIEKKCGKFELTSTQKFLKRFLNPRNPYRSMLLFHGTGVGKSCSAVSIAEGFLPELRKISKKVYVLLNPSVKESFRKNIFLKLKLDGDSEDVYEQCTRDTYLKNIALKNTEKNRYKIKKIIDQQINNSYEFMGYLQFANMVENKIINKINRREDLTKKEKETRIMSGIRQLFSDSVIIIDEVHNIKQNAGNVKEEKKITSVLENVIEYAENLKLILLTATPMFDVPDEIIYILNLLLLNERRGKMSEKVFFKNNKLIDSKINLFRYKTQGLVSYVRGENPIFFPAKLYPDEVIDINLMPTTTVINSNEVEIPEDERISNLQLVPAVMGEKQQEVYNQVLLEDKDSFRSATVNCSNVVFPSNEDVLKSKYGKSGFNACFEKVGEGTGIRSLKYKPVKDFDLDNFVNSIGDYSGKIKAILDNIKKSTGVVFIYSRFVWSGIIPIAFCLEKLGFSRYGSGGNLLTGITPSTDFKIKNVDTPRYIVITGESAFDSESIYKQYLDIEKDNADGSQVKVILGTESAAEGLDFKMIREVHILEPYFHLSKNDQVIGRGIRRCSHKQLDFKDRNVTVYQYAGVKHGESGSRPYTETVDFDLYRKAELKDKNVAKVTYELKKNSVDCEINFPINTFFDEKWNEPVIVRNSRGDKKVITLGNSKNSNGDYKNDFERDCNYEKCVYKCNSSISNWDDKSTFKYSDDILDLVFEVQEAVIKILKKNNAIHMTDLFNHYEIMKLNVKDEKEMLYYALDDLIESKREFVNNFNMKCKVNRFEDMYLLLPLSMKDMTPTILEIIEGELEKKGKLHIDLKTIFKNQELKEKKSTSAEKETKNNSDSMILDILKYGAGKEYLYQLPISIINKLCETVIPNKDKYRKLYYNLKALNFIMDKDHPVGFFTIVNKEIVFRYLNNEQTSTKPSFKTEGIGEPIYNLAITEYKRKMPKKDQGLPKKLIALFEYDDKKEVSLFKIKDNRVSNDEKRRTKRGAVCVTTPFNTILNDYYKTLHGKAVDESKLLSIEIENRPDQSEENKIVTKDTYSSIIDFPYYHDYKNKNEIKINIKGISVLTNKDGKKTTTELDVIRQIEKIDYNETTKKITLTLKSSDDKKKLYGELKNVIINRKQKARFQLCSKLIDAFVKNNTDKSAPTVFSIIDTILFLKKI